MGFPVTLFTILAWSLPAVIALATIEGLILTFVARRAYDWRSYAASVTDALVRNIVYALVTVSVAGPAHRVRLDASSGDRPAERPC